MFGFGKKDAVDIVALARQQFELTKKLSSDIVNHIKRMNPNVSIPVPANGNGAHVPTTKQMQKACVDNRKLLEQIKMRTRVMSAIKSNVVEKVKK